ncbi:MAG: hypothetical protein GXP42_18735 [Chloroflexi bacterium]|nr:hypothetical protein [Chloroflexota bacterium]
MEEKRSKCQIRIQDRLVEWWIEPSSPTRISSPWGQLWLGASRGQGQEVWVEAQDAFDMILHYEGVSFFERASRGRHRFLLTVLDRTDVA